MAMDLHFGKFSIYVKDLNYYRLTSISGRFAYNGRCRCCIFVYIKLP